MLKEIGQYGGGAVAIGLTSMVLAPPSLANRKVPPESYRSTPGTPHHIQLRNPASLPNWGDEIGNDDFAVLSDSSVGIYERPKGSSGPYTALCSGNIVSISAGSEDAPQKDVLTAEHCFDVPDASLEKSAPAVNIASTEPNEYAISMPQLPGSYGFNIGHVVGISIIVNSGNKRTLQPDAALLSIEPVPLPDGTQAYVTAPALRMTPQLRPKPGEQVASFSFPFQAGRTVGESGVDVYLGRRHVTQVDSTGRRPQIVDIVASRVTNPRFDPHQYGTSGHLEKTASGVILGPDSLRTGILGIKNQPQGTDPSLKVAQRERRLAERLLGLNLSRFNVIEFKTVLSSLNLKQLVQGLGNMAVLKTGPKTS